MEKQFKHETPYGVVSETYDTEEKVIRNFTKSHDKYYNAQAGSSHLETAYEQASYCGFGDYSDYC